MADKTLCRNMRLLTKRQYSATFKWPFIRIILFRTFGNKNHPVTVFALNNEKEKA